jgi:hypothetical protein
MSEATCGPDRNDKQQSGRHAAEKRRGEAEGGRHFGVRLGGDLMEDAERQSSLGQTGIERRNAKGKRTRRARTCEPRQQPPQFLQHLGMPGARARPRRQVAMAAVTLAGVAIAGVALAGVAIAGVAMARVAIVAIATIERTQMAMVGYGEGAGHGTRGVCLSSCPGMLEQKENIARAEDSPRSTY